LASGHPTLTSGPPFS